MVTATLAINNYQQYLTFQIFMYVKIMELEPTTDRRSIHLLDKINILKICPIVKNASYTKSIRKQSHFNNPTLKTRVEFTFWWLTRRNSWTPKSENDWRRRANWLNCHVTANKKVEQRIRFFVINWNIQNKYSMVNWSSTDVINST